MRDSEEEEEEEEEDAAPAPKAQKLMGDAIKSGADVGVKTGGSRVGGPELCV